MREALESSYVCRSSLRRVPVAGNQVNRSYSLAALQVKPRFFVLGCGQQIVGQGADQTRVRRHRFAFSPALLALPPLPLPRPPIGARLLVAGRRADSMSSASADIESLLTGLRGREAVGQRYARVREGRALVSKFKKGALGAPLAAPSRARRPPRRTCRCRL
jgi:hypothetical protein